MHPKVLVTGGSGFIGTHLVSALARGGYSVRVLDLRSPIHRVAGVDYIQGDVHDRTILERAVSESSCVFHFAALVSVPQCQVEPLKSYQENLMATCVVLETIRQVTEKSHRKLRLVFSGSSAVYGSIGTKGVKITESPVCTSPTTFYMAEKLASEHAVSIYHSTFGIPSVVFRFFNVFGVGQDSSCPYSGVISKFASNLLENKHLTLFGSGTQTRDFISVQDVVKACLLAIKLPDDACDGLPINLGSGISVSIRDLAFKMMEICGNRVPVAVGPERKGEVLHSLAAIDRAKNVLGWNPKVSLDMGLAELFENLRAPSLHVSKRR